MPATPAAAGLNNGAAKSTYTTTIAYTVAAKAGTLAYTLGGLAADANVQTIIFTGTGLTTGVA